MAKRPKGKADEEAQRILEEANVNHPPVPIEKLAKMQGAQIRFSPLDDELSGTIYVKDGTPIIGVNALHHPNRQHFTIAHELGHLLLHKSAITREVHVDKQFPMLMRDAHSTTGTDTMEIEANTFAAEILMPERLLRQELDLAFDIDDDEFLTVIAQRFKVSLTALKYRVGNLFYL